MQHSWNLTSTTLKSTQIAVLDFRNHHFTEITQITSETMKSLQKLWNDKITTKIIQSHMENDEIITKDIKFLNNH